MRKIYLTDSDLRNLKKYSLSNHIDHTESDLYIFDKNKLLKLFKKTDEDFIINKMYVLNKLFYIKNHINIDSIIMPEDLIKVDNISFGYTMEYIKNIDGSTYLKNSNISLSDKINFLKGIYYIISEIENNALLKSMNFHLGDIHESNFIYNKNKKIVNAVDIDSVYFDGVNTPISKFLLFNDKLWDFNNKYPLDIDNRHIPNKNTTIISFIYMLLNFITEEYSPNFNKKKFCETLNILYHVGFDKELCDSIYNIYSTKENYFYNYYLDTITPELILKYREIKNAKK